MTLRNERLWMLLVVKVARCRSCCSCLDASGPLSVCSCKQTICTPVVVPSGLKIFSLTAWPSVPDGVSTECHRLSNLEIL
jgi:hypothetical protein